MKLYGVINCPSDKSISQRAIILSAIASGKSTITNLSNNNDTLSCINCFKKLGIQIDADKISNKTTIEGKGFFLHPYDTFLNAQNSGTSFRLISGILSGQHFKSTIIGDASLSNRPMKRIILPLEQMNAKIKHNNYFAPLSFYPSTLFGIHYKMPIASAQVKSCILLASLYSNSATQIDEDIISRNHTEIMLKEYGANINVIDNKITLSRTDKLYPQNFTICSDISSAAFFICAAILIKDSDVIFKNVGLNKTRSGLLSYLKRSNAHINIYKTSNIDCIEEYGDIHVQYSKLTPMHIKYYDIPSLIDEIPILAVVCMFIDGQSTIENIEELKFKESNRINGIISLLSSFGCDVTYKDNKLIICGNDILYYKKSLANKKEIFFNTNNDHRMAMSYIILCLILDKPINNKLTRCISISYPDFFKDLQCLIK